MLKKFDIIFMIVWLIFLVSKLFIDYPRELDILVSIICFIYIIVKITQVVRIERRNS